MAGIIAQLTRAARSRRDRRTYGTNKCLYTLEPFDTNGFKVRWWKGSMKYPVNIIIQADLHNKYCVKKARWEEHLRVMQEEEELITEFYREYKVMKDIIYHSSLFLFFSGRRDGKTTWEEEFSMVEMPRSHDFYNSNNDFANIAASNRASLLLWNYLHW